MTRVFLVHWHEQECLERAERLRDLGYFVDCHWQSDQGTALTRGLTADPPAALIVDLSRLPSHGRSVAIWMRRHKAMRSVPLVFVPGDAEKTARTREEIPDAVYAAWPRMAVALPQAIATPQSDPFVPKNTDYSGTPLPQKLGVKNGGRLSVLGAPKGFDETLGALPAGAEVKKRLGGERDVILVFCLHRKDLQAVFTRAAACLAPRGSLWVAWPKKSAGTATDLSEDVVREFGLAEGLVDTKVCAIDKVWSGLRFSQRRAGSRARRGS